MEVIQLKMISTLKNTMTSGRFASTTFTQAVQGLISAYMTPYFKGEHKKDHKVQQEKNDSTNILNILMYIINPI